MSLRRPLLLPLLAGLAGSLATTAATAACLDAPAYRAAQVRQLQTEMMVTALKCNGHPTLPLTAQYNTFVNRFGGELNRNAGVLRTRFPGGKLDQLVTTMANDASMRSLSVVGYCEEQAPMFEKVLGASDSQLDDIASDVVGNRLPVTACAVKRPPTTVADKPQTKKVAAKKEKEKVVRN